MIISFEYVRRARDTNDFDAVAKVVTFSVFAFQGEDQRKKQTHMDTWFSSEVNKHFMQRLVKRVVSLQSHFNERLGYSAARGFFFYFMNPICRLPYR